MQRKWLVLLSVSLMYFFVSSSTFTSLGVVLFSMVRDLHWTQTEAGISFSILGLTCCLSSLAPMALIDRIGARWTMLAGGLVLSAGFLLAFLTRGLLQFFLATGLMGVGFTLAANIPGVFLLAQWFPHRSGRIIGVYLMFGAMGGVAGPPIAHAIAVAQGWRALWLLLAVAGVALGIVCLLLIRDGAGRDAEDVARAPARRTPARDWRYREAVLTPQFAILALAMVVTEACVTTVNSAGVLHFSKLGVPAGFAALMLSLQALTATAGKGLSGAIGDWVDPRLLLVGGLLVQSLGVVVLGFAGTPASAYLFAVSFGVGWGTAYLAITVLLIEYFGPRTGSAALSLVWLLTTFAALGPAAAGMVADRFGGYAPVFDTGGALLVPIAFAALMMRRPVAASAGDASLPDTAGGLVADAPV